MIRRADNNTEVSYSQIQLELRDINQLFHSMDPSPFREKDLDLNAEEFIVSWARELPKSGQFLLKIHLANPPAHDRDAEAIGEAVRNYFNYRAGQFALRNRELLREGWMNLAIGLSFLATCLLIARYMLQLGSGALIAIAHESLIIGGWVAMWRPMQIFLYDRWPLSRMQSLYRRLGNMDVELVVKQQAKVSIHRTET
jgi:hypothetical protein